MIYCWCNLLTIILGVVVTGKLIEDSCSVSKNDNNFSSYAGWANSIPALLDRDQQTLAEFESVVADLDTTADDKVVELFYKFISSPLQTQCRVGKWLAFSRYDPKL